MAIESLAMIEIARFFASQPTPEQILAFHASPEVNERIKMLIASEKTGTSTPEERRELDGYEAIEHIIIHTKAEASRKLKQ